ATYDEACNIGYCSIMGATIGGWGGNYTTVSTLQEFVVAVAGTQTAVILVNGTLSGSTQVAIGSGKSILGLPGSALHGVSLSLAGSRNVILRNLRITNTTGHAISLSSSRSVWVDHCDLSTSSATSSLLSISHGSDYITVTQNFIHDHPSTAISVSQSSDNVAEDEGKFHITFIGNHVKNVGTAVSFGTGTGHLFNSYYENATMGINARNGADLLVESSVFEGSTTAIFSSDSAKPGKVTVVDVVLGEGINTAPKGEMNADSVPYPYDWAVLSSSVVKATVVKEAGAKLHY
ncbi:pectin lyase fold/virulence factor, partial [Cercophora newfieldiana]